jgi:hypothetical protein
MIRVKFSQTSFIVNLQILKWDDQLPILAQSHQVLIHLIDSSGKNIITVLIQ